MRYSEVASIFRDPIEPFPYYERSIMLREFPAEGWTSWSNSSAPTPEAP